MDEKETKTNPPSPEKPKGKRGKRPSVLWVLIPAVALLALAGFGALRFGWLDSETGSAALPVATLPPAAPTATPSPAPAPLFAAEQGYIACPDGLFSPESPLTVGEAAAILSAAGRSVNVGEREDEPLTERALEHLTERATDRETAAGAMDAVRGLGDETVTRAEAAVFFNRLFGLAPSETERVYLPDAAPDYWAWAEIQTAASDSFRWPGVDGRLAPGFLTREGYLYLADEDGYFVKNRFEGSLYFDNTGRYTSGSYELDGYVAEMLRSVTNDGMTREEMLREAYLYVRDSFTYLVRHIYNIGDEGWPLQEALTMYSTGRGNCYCYASAFWAAARQLGYEAKTVSGTYGRERAPHGWVEIYQEDGSRLTYDPEVEMVMRRSKGVTGANLYAMTDGGRRNHMYVETLWKDNIMPRETNAGLLPR